ncbi:tetratricopeptide repeat protein [Pseudanabaena sp. FACHB-1277]|uniref:Tetratricopeptide repeat protein n=1 Tax=Pseudanabaena cinerea FACHB-1277 TaxID=2949581 RepID=A0A926UPY8_9CYAN|nr:tetratricopeptide repeat protein [Pseudanabaena cinerea]MBD2148688.1 tetratricopeptide repeat protein [Pseudanabaena cinerea FACHB-1277]
MKSEAIDWEQDLPLDADEAYQSLVRSLRRTDGFALLFVRCSPIQGEQIITDIGNDLKDKNIQVLELNESIDNLYDRIAALDDLEHLNILFIKGIEQSIFAYEDREVHDINLRSRSLQYGGTWQNVPRVLGHLNLSRERFRDNFKFCIVFLLPEFALRYFIRRAPDFFDWRSNIYDFPTEKSLVDQESLRLVSGGSFDEYEQLTNEQRITKLCQIKSYIDESADSTQISELWAEKGLIHASAKEYEEAITSYDQALQIKPEDDYTWMYRGNALSDLGRNEEAITSYNQVLQINPEDYEACYNRGNALFNLGRYEESISAYDKVLQIQSDFYKAWHNRGFALSYLGRDEESIFSYDQASQFSPHKHESFNMRGNSLSDLGRYEEAISYYDQALQIKPDYHKVWNNRGSALGNLGRDEEAIASFDRALQIKPDYHEAWNNRGSALGNLGRDEEAMASFEQALQIKPDYHEAWYNRGIVLGELRRYEEAIASYDRALQIKPDKYEAWYNKACAYSLINAIELALENLQKAIQLNPDENREMAKTDSDFDNIRHDPRFQALIQ